MNPTENDAHETLHTLPETDEHPHQAWNLNRIDSTWDWGNHTCP